MNPAAEFARKLIDHYDKEKAEARQRWINPDEFRRAVLGLLLELIERIPRVAATAATEDDDEAVVESFLASVAKLSARRVEKATGVSDATVGRLRRMKKAGSETRIRASTRRLMLRHLRGNR